MFLKVKLKHASYPETFPFFFVLVIKKVISEKEI